MTLRSGIPTDELVTAPTQPTFETSCPICGNDMTLYLETERENGEFGTTLSQYDVVSDDPDEAIYERSCHCDLTKPVMGAWAEYLNGGALDQMQQAHADWLADQLSDFGDMPSNRESLARLIYAVHRYAHLPGFYDDFELGDWSNLYRMVDPTWEPSSDGRYDPEGTWPEGSIVTVPTDRSLIRRAADYIEADRAWRDAWSARITDEPTYERLLTEAQIARMRFGDEDVAGLRRIGGTE